MTRSEFAELVRSVGIPSAYRFFSEDTAKDPPFICFFDTGDNDFKADNKNYTPIRIMAIELYTDEKDFALEGAIESVLQAADLTYTVEPDYLDDERLYVTVFTTEVVIDGEQN